MPQRTIGAKKSHFIVTDRVLLRVAIDVVMALRMPMDGCGKIKNGLNPAVCQYFFVILQAVSYRVGLTASIMALFSPALAVSFVEAGPVPALLIASEGT